LKNSFEKGIPNQSNEIQKMQSQKHQASRSIEKDTQSKRGIVEEAFSIKAYDKKLNGMQYGKLNTFAKG
jgi:hypothetical protein